MSTDSQQPEQERSSQPPVEAATQPRDPFRDFQEDSEVIEEVEQDGKKVRRKGIYLLPNIFTTSALFAGFFAVVSALNGDYSTAAIAIFISMILDGFDGRIARFTHTQSAFGAEYDSLSDMLSFGVAPALVAFSWSLQSLGKLGWICAFIFVAGAALRLARFNVQLAETDKKWFVGLPSPSAAAVIASCVWTFHSFDISSVRFNVVMALITAICGILMVSNFRYYSFKVINFKTPVPFVALLALVLIFAIVSIQPSIILLIFFGLYAISAPLMALWKLKSAKLKSSK